MNAWMELATLIGATFVSEDLTCVGTGLLVRAGRLDGWLGVFGCFLGIFIGDLGLWGLGRGFGRRALRWPWLQRQLPEGRLDQMERWFFYRFPGELAGRILSITDKHFPYIAGDGCSTLEELIWAHPRYRMQAGTFLARHAHDRDRVLAAGETLRLVVAGNHCQGTLFRDGAHLLTPELEQAVNAIIRPFDGFCFGRFDVRYSDVEAFKAGRDLAVVELNGVVSESTNLYDPSWPLVRAYRTLYHQWHLLFQIGDANRRRGIQPTGVAALARSVFAYYRGRHIDLLAD